MRAPSFTIRTFAVICVAATSAYVMWMGYRLNETLSGPGWCRTALGAEKASSSDGTIKGLDACVGLLTIQLKSLSTNSHILLGSIALCLAVLIIIVVAGAKFSGEVSASGAKASVVPADEPLPVTITNAPNEPVPTKAVPTDAPVGPSMPEPKP
jgi:hypothetical protein